MFAQLKILQSDNLIHLGIFSSGSDYFAKLSFNKLLLSKRFLIFWFTDENEKYLILLTLQEPIFALSFFSLS